MFTAMYNGLVLKCASKDTYESLKTVDITRQTIEMFLLQCYEVNENIATDSNNETESALHYNFQLLLVLDKHLDWLIDLNIQEHFNSISGYQYSKETMNIKKTIQVQTPSNKNVMDKMNSLHCLFTWNLQTIRSKKDLISQIIKKYGNNNLDISLPVFTFKRFISNIIIGYELFKKGKKETAKVLLFLIGKWLEELDKCTDDFYLLISDGLKYVLKSTLAHMMIENFSEDIQLLLDIIPFTDLSYHSKAAVHAIQANVLIEYGYNDDCFKKAVECINRACDLDSKIPYWFYLHSLVLRAQRLFLLTYKSCPSENEKNTIQRAILLSNVQDINFRFHEVILLKDLVLYNFHKNKNGISKKKLTNENHLCEEQKIVSMIKKLISLEPTDPLILINCVKILRTLSTTVHDLNFEKELLVKGLQLAPIDLAVLKCVAGQVIIHVKKTIKNNNMFKNQNLIINKRANLGEDLKIAVEKHKLGEDPVVYLTSILNNYDSHTQWKILAQICSFIILFNDNLNAGVKIFMMLVEAEGNKTISSDLILCHYSSFVNKREKFNLAQLISEEILIRLKNSIDHYENEYYFNVLTQIISKYDFDMNSFRFSLSMLDKQQNNLKSSDCQSDVIVTTDENSGSEKDTNDDNSICVVSIVDSNDANDQNNDDNNNSCCMCRVM